METQAADDTMWKGQGHIDTSSEVIPASHMANMLLQVTFNDMLNYLLYVCTYKTSICHCLKLMFCQESIY